MVKRNMLLALLGAFVLHIVFFIVQILSGIVQTFFYQPQFAPDDVVLQSTISFGMTAQGSPAILLASYIIVALILFALFQTRKLFKRKV